jgi:hypothetical protein
MYTKAAVLATSVTSLPMWDPEGCRMVPRGNMESNFRDTPPQMAEIDVAVVDWLSFADGCSCWLCYLSYAWCTTHVVPYLLPGV